LLKWAILILPLVRVASYFLFPAVRWYLGLLPFDPILVGSYIYFERTNLAKKLGPFLKNDFFVAAVVISEFFLIPNATLKLGGYWSCTYGRLLESCLIGIIMLALMERKDYWLSRLLRTKGFVAIGTISYSLYLWQQIFMVPNPIFPPIFFVFPVNIAAPMIIAGLSYNLLEKPFMQGIKTLEKVSA
jgi:peptidoglycan/LPS O-acetylase OafA/YrhL